MNKNEMIAELKRLLAAYEAMPEFEAHQDSTQKKTIYLTTTSLNAQTFQLWRKEAASLREQLASDAVIAGIVDADCTGPNSYMVRATVDNFLTGVNAVIEAALTNGAVATLNRLPLLLAAIPGAGG